MTAHLKHNILRNFSPWLICYYNPFVCTSAELVTLTGGVVFTRIKDFLKNLIGGADNRKTITKIPKIDAIKLGGRSKDSDTPSNHADHSGPSSKIARGINTI